MTFRLPGSHRRLLILVFSFAIVLAGGFLFNGLSVLRSADMELSEQRMALAPSRATGSIALIAIDKKSLDKVGVWPWPRSTYAAIVEQLTKAGVRDIAFDIDFSNRSTEREDRAFADALAAAGGGVILPAFLQKAAVEQSQQQLVLSEPIPELAAQSWLASVNVVPDEKGLVRDMPYGIRTPGGTLPSIPVMLSGRDDQSIDRFRVDFAISPATVPVYSVASLLDGKLAKGALDGKSVVIGAQAVELKDYFAVPVHGNIPGPMLQIIAAETLLKGRALTEASPWFVGGAAAAALILFLVVRPRRLTGQYLVLGSLALGFEIVAFVLYRNYAIHVPTAAVHCALAATAFARTVLELDIRGWLLRVAALENRNTRQILEQVINDNSDAILVADEGGVVLEMNGRVREVFRAARAQVGGAITSILPDRLVNEATTMFLRLKAGEDVRPLNREIVLPSDDGMRCIEYSVTPSRLERPEGVAFVICFAARDITEKRRQQEALDRMSRFDQLTGALRQTEFVERLEHVLAQIARDGGSSEAITVYSLNLHRFKTINATLGRDVGDSLLVQVARTLETIDPGVVLVARTGGDAFCLARRGPRDVQDAERFADALIRKLGVPLLIEGHRANVGLHIGFATAARSSPPDAETLLDNAEFALDSSRAINGSGWSRFDPAASDRIARFREMEQELWRALEKNEISVTYQPQVKLADNQVIGAEALVRWNHPALGRISPADFVEIAEANGFVENLGRWVLRRACVDATTWERPLTVAVNVSPLQFTRGDVVADVADALRESGLAPERLQLEITESTFLDQSGDLVEKLHTLKAFGVTLALDDFGTGYSSFGYLSKFPIDKLKLDQMFVRTLTDSASSKAIIRSVRSLCEGLKIVMICEGVETEEQRSFLVNVGCEQGQGWLFGRPQDNEAIRLLAAGGPADGALGTATR